MHQPAYTFHQIAEEVVQRHDENLHDRTVHLSDLRMNDEGFLHGEGIPTLALNEFARRGLATILGIRWQKWFDKATDAERAEEVSRRFQRTPGQIKIRAKRDREGKAEGIARAFLSPSFTPIDDRRIFDQLASTFRGVDDYRITRVNFTDATSNFTFVRPEPADLKGDALNPGFHLRNSEVGAAAFTLDDFWLRQVCSNGLMIQVGDKRLLYRTHRSIDDDHLAAAMVVALKKLPERWEGALSLMQRAKEITVPHPDAAVAAALDSGEIPKALVQEAQAVVLRESDHTRFGVVQAITFVAHQTNKDPDVRFAMERLAGAYLSAA